MASPLTKKILKETKLQLLQKATIAKGKLR